MAKTEHDEHIFVNNFVVDMGGEQKHIRKVSPITMRIPKIETTTGLDKWKTWRPGRPNFGNITFEGAEHKGADGTKIIRDWVKTAYDGKDARKDITITVKNQKGEDVRTFDLVSCLPVAYSSIDLGSQGGAQTMHWVLEVRVQQIRMK
jgi:phage tail-like protein